MSENPPLYEETYPSSVDFRLQRYNNFLEYANKSAFLVQICYENCLQSSLKEAIRQEKQPYLDVVRRQNRAGLHKLSEEL